jgi:hypothetical protein
VNRLIIIKPGQLRCPRCFGRDIVPSLPRGLTDSLMRMAHRVPRHCRACGKRFYASEALLEESLQAARNEPAIIDKNCDPTRGA